MAGAKAIHDGRSAYNHLLRLAQSDGIARRVEEVLDIVGLTSVARIIAAAVATIGLSAYPLSFEEALQAALAVDPRKVGTETQAEAQTMATAPSVLREFFGHGRHRYLHEQIT